MVLRVSLGQDGRRLSNPEKQQLQRYADFDTELAKSKICRSAVRETDDCYLKVFRIKFFTNVNQQYIVSLNAASIICRYSCDFIVTKKSVYKGMFLTE